MNNLETNNRRARPRLLSFLIAAVFACWAGVISPLNASAQTNTRIISLNADLKFGKVLVGSSSDRVLTISNEGNSTLTVSNVYVAMIRPALLLGGFSGSWSGTIAPGKSQDALITFSPGGTVSGATNDVDYGGYVVVDSDATGGNASIPVSGVGTFGPPVRSISLNELNLNFGNVEIGGPSSLPLIISNSGNSVLTISNITLPDGFLFSFFGPDTQSVSATLDPDSGTNFFVFFNPTNVADYAGTVTINSDATGGAGEFTVSGEGVYPTGRYVGLFYPLLNTALTNSGQFSATAGGGAVSGVLQLTGKRYPFSGRLSPSGAFSVELTNDLYVSFQAFPGACVGTVSNDTWIANLYAGRLLGGGTPRPIQPFKPGKYQMAIVGSADPQLGPTNDGVGTIRIAESPTVLLSGTLGDGTKFSQGTLMCEGSQIPFYASLYGGQGVVLGWIHCVVVPTNLPEAIFPPITNSPLFTNTPPFTNIVFTNFPPFTNTVPFTNIVVPTNFSPVPAELALSRTTRYGHRPPPEPVHIFGTNDIWGSINWFKPPQIDTNYPNGFSFETEVTGPLP